MPAADLTADMNREQFKKDLLSMSHYADIKPYIIIELNQQGNLPSDSIIWPLLDFCRACGGKSKVIVATRDEDTRRRFKQANIGSLFTAVASGKAAIELVDFELFAAHIATEQGRGI